MIPKEKAKELIERFYIELDLVNRSNLKLFDVSKQFALIAVEEILAEIKKVFSIITAELNSTYRFWQAVKAELLALTE